MSATGAAFTGLGKVLGSPSVVLWLWLANVAVALPAAVMLSDSIRDSVGASLVDEKLREGFDMGWYGEYLADAKGIESSFTPTVVGAGAFFNNIEVWFNGNLFEVHPGLLGLGILYALLWSLFLGGVLHRYGEAAGLFRWRSSSRTAASTSFVSCDSRRSRACFTTGSIAFPTGSSAESSARPRT